MILILIGISGNCPNELKKIHFIICKKFYNQSRFMVVEIEVQSTSVFLSGKENCTVMGIIYNVCLGVIAYFFFQRVIH